MTMTRTLILSQLVSVVLQWIAPSTHPHICFQLPLSERRAKVHLHMESGHLQVYQKLLWYISPKQHKGQHRIQSASMNEEEDFPMAKKMKVMGDLGVQV